MQSFTLGNAKTPSGAFRVKPRPPVNRTALPDDGTAKVQSENEESSTQGRPTPLSLGIRISNVERERLEGTARSVFFNEGPAMLVTGVKRPPQWGWNTTDQTTSEAFRSHRMIFSDALRNEEPTTYTVSSDALTNETSTTTAETDTDDASTPSPHPAGKNETKSEIPKWRPGYGAPYTTCYLQLLLDRVTIPISLPHAGEKGTPMVSINSVNFSTPRIRDDALSIVVGQGPALAHPDTTGTSTQNVALGLEPTSRATGGRSVTPSSWRVVTTMNETASESRLSNTTRRNSTAPANTGASANATAPTTATSAPNAATPVPGRPGSERSTNGTSTRRTNGTTPRAADNRPNETAPAVAEPPRGSNASSTNTSTNATASPIPPSNGTATPINGTAANATSTNATLSPTNATNATARAPNMTTNASSASNGTGTNATTSSNATMAGTNTTSSSTPTPAPASPSKPVHPLVADRENLDVFVQVDMAITITSPFMPDYLLPTTVLDVLLDPSLKRLTTRATSKEGLIEQGYKTAGTVGLPSIHFDRNTTVYNPRIRYVPDTPGPLHSTVNICAGCRLLYPLSLVQAIVWIHNVSHPLIFLDSRVAWSRDVSLSLKLLETLILRKNAPGFHVVRHSLVSAEDEQLGIVPATGVYTRDSEVVGNVMALLLENGLKMAGDFVRIALIESSEDVEIVVCSFILSTVHYDINI